MSESVTKKYCCSNRAPIEAVNVGTFDLIISIIGFVSTSVFTYFYTWKHENLNAASAAFGTVQKFITLTGETQNGILIGLFIITGLKIFHSILLLTGAISQNSLLLKLWILLCVPIGLGASVTAFLLAFYAKEKLLFGFLALFYVAFHAYTIWIIREYGMELRTVSARESQLQLQPKLSKQLSSPLEENS